MVFGLSPLQPQWSLPQGRREISERGGLDALEEGQKIYEEKCDENTCCWILEIPGTRFVLKHTLNNCVVTREKEVNSSCTLYITRFLDNELSLCFVSLIF